MATPKTDLTTTNYNGADSFTYKVNDSELDSAIATVTLTVTAVNDAPVVASRTVTLDEDATVSFNLLANATDVDGDSLTATVTKQLAHGSLTLNADGTYTYTPNANFNGTDSLSYFVNDGTVVISSTISFIVNAVNDAPVLL